MQSGDKKGEKVKSCNKIVHAFPKSSSVPILTQVYQSDTNIRKFFYIIILIFSTGACFYHVLRFVDVYLKYHVLNFVEVRRNWNSEFPAVTICNLNRMRLSSTNYEVVEDEFPISVKSEVPIVLTERKMFSFPEISNDSSVQDEAKTFFNYYTNLPEFTREIYGYEMWEMIEECYFDSLPCYQNNFTLFQNLQYGNCYTFNKIETMEDFRLKSYRTGSDKGLEVTLNIHMDEYLDVTPSVGMRVVIHDAREEPNPVESGINISPGLETHIAVTKSSIHRLPPPYRDQCFDYENKDNKFRFSSQLECIRNCTQETSLLKCSCVEPFLNARHNAKRCDLKNTTEMTCLDSVLEDFKVFGLPCKCPIACITNQYNIETSASSWTDHARYEATSKFLRITTKRDNSYEADYIHNFSNGALRNNLPLINSVLFPMENNSKIYEWNYFNSYMKGVKYESNISYPFATEASNNYIIQEDVPDDYSYSDTANVYDADKELKQMRAKLKVFFKNFDNTIYFQTPMLTENEVISHIGGLLSLWLGLNILAIFEFFETAVICVRGLATSFT